MNKAVDCTLIYTEPLCYYDANELRQAVFAERMLFDVLGSLQPVLMNVIAGRNPVEAPFEFLYHPEDLEKLLSEHTGETIYEDGAFTDNVIAAANKLLDSRLRYELLAKEGEYEQMEFFLEVNVDADMIRLKINHLCLPYLPYMKVERKGM